MHFPRSANCGVLAFSADSKHRLNRLIYYSITSWSIPSQRSLLYAMRICTAYALENGP